MVVANAEGIILWVNRAFTKVTGYPQEFAVGNSTRILKSGVQGLDFYEAFWNSLIVTGHWSGEIWNRRSDGSLYREWLEIYPLNFERQGRYYFTVFQEITNERDITLDIQMAGKLQRSLAPKPILDNDDVHIQTAQRGMYSVTGDLYDYLWLNDRVLIGFIADVMGHGMSAAMQAGTVRVLFKETLQQTTALGEALKVLNKSIGHYLANDTFAAALCFIVDVENAEFRYASAGIHTFYHQDGLGLHKIQVDSLYLGVAEDVEFNEYRLRLHRGDRLYLMTDGFYDLLPSTIQSFPIRLETIDNDIERFLGQFLIQDDITLMNIELL